jgi:preprotein translocase subunit SecD
MLRPYWRNLVFILIIIAVGIWMALPNNPGIHFAGINKVIETRLGLDLVGGVQALLEADLPPGTEVSDESMSTVVRIVENRVNALGVNESVVQKAGTNRVVVELPGETDPERALAVLRQTGLLEFVDFSMVDDNTARMMIGQTIYTDFAVEGSEPSPAPEGQPVFHTIMTGVAIRSAAADIIDGSYVVAFELNPEGSRIFADWTTRNVGNILAIVLDKEVISAPGVNDPITAGQGLISGAFTYEEANALAVQLRYGSLPVPLKVVETRTIGPTLGQDSLQKSLIAGAIGFAIVILFMSLYYRVPGLVAVVTILIYAVVAYAIFRFIPVTLTLPGIAGFLLSTGSALDANILIFERFKEELRSGRTIRHSIELAFTRAWPSIRDSNIATLITCGVLFYFGNTFGATIVKGFALTLGIGVAISVFTALLVTRTLLTLLFNYVQPENKERWFGI